MAKKETKGVNQDDLKKALDQLDELDTSLKKSEDETGVDDLAKAVKDAEKDLEDLAKSADEEDDKDKKEDDGKKGDDEDKSEGAKPDAMDKSEDDSFEDLLVKSSQEATEAFEALQKSVNEQVGGINTEVSQLRKSVESLLSLGVKQARVIGGLVKSLQEMGGRAVAPNSTKLGLGNTEKEKLEKSNSEIQDLLEKAVNEDKISIDALSRFASHKVNGLNADEKQIIGL